MALRAVAVRAAAALAQRPGVQWLQLWRMLTHPSSPGSGDAYARSGSGSGSSSSLVMHQVPTAALLAWYGRQAVTAPSTAEERALAARYQRYSHSDHVTYADFVRELMPSV